MGNSTDLFYSTWERFAPGATVPQSSLQREAMEAALAGDWSKADALELAFLNDTYNQVFPHTVGGPEIGEEGFVAKEIWRSWGPDCITAVQWDSTNKCEDCDGNGHLVASGKTTKEVDCPTRDGTGESEMAERIVYTDIDGLILQEEDTN